MDNRKKPGTVFLVGAGPGHPGLITRLGHDLLQRCDAVAYDALIPMELIASLPDTIERYYVGKRSGKHSLPQSKINELLASLAKRGLTVVRLKGGDPAIFGRCGEEAEFLAGAGIPVITIPGVTAASAVAAISGFSLTHRHTSSWIFLATGHGAESASTPVPWDRIAALPGGTLVIYMGLARLDHLVSQLLRSGLSPETPAMVVQAASTGVQMSVEAPLANLAFECRCRGLVPPALIVIGESLRCRTNGTGSLNDVPAGLKAKRILVTSPAQTTVRFCELLRKAGAEPIPYPTATWDCYDDAEGWSHFGELIKDRSFCLFTNEWEADGFLDLLIEHGWDHRGLSRSVIVAWGDSVKVALLRRGIRADEVIEPPDFSMLASRLRSLDPMESLPLIWPRGNFENPSLESDLRRLPVRIFPLMVRTQKTAVWEAHWAHELISNPPDYMAFTGVAEVNGFFELLGEDVARHLAGKCCIAALDGLVAASLQSRSLAVQVEAHEAGVEGLVSALMGHSKQGPSSATISRVC
jgi:uroporphyrinogen III methyltransferase / synthase